MQLNDVIKIKVKRVIEFLDEKPQNSWGHATSIVSIAGEDLGASAFKHYIERSKNNTKVNIITGSVTTGKKKGPRLDRWIDVEWPDKTGTIFQTEIKNWSAHAIGGTPLSLNASPEEMRMYKIRKWRENWDTDKNEPNNERISKVLVPMKRPQEVNQSHILEPLVIYWFAIHPQGEDEPFFYQTLTNNSFSRIWFFSISTYLRSLKEDVIELNMPFAAKRIEWLLKLFEVQEK